MTIRTEDVSNTAEKDFLAELKSQFDREIDIRKTLDTKANTMITVASGVSTLLIAIATFLIGRIVDRDIYYGISILIFAIGIVLATIAIWRFIKSYALRSYKYPIGHEYFFVGDEYQSKRVEDVRNKPQEFLDKIYKGYLESIKKASKLNGNKALSIEKGQNYLRYTLISVAILVTYILVTYGVGLIKLQ